MNEEYRDLLELVEETLNDLNEDAVSKTKKEIENIIGSLEKIEVVPDLMELQDKLENLKDMERDNTYFVTDITNLITDIEETIRDLRES
jgi:hypothetical protein